MPYPSKFAVKLTVFVPFGTNYDTSGYFDDTTEEQTIKEVQMDIERAIDKAGYAAEIVDGEIVDWPYYAVRLEQDERDES